MMSLAFRVVSLPLLLAYCLNSAADEPPKEGDDGRKAKANIKISKETTYIEEPVGKDGYINYIEALNQRLSKGITTKNNAAVVVCKVIGPNGGELRGMDEYRDKLFKRLGIGDLPEEGDYFMTMYQLAEIDGPKLDRPRKADELINAYYEEQMRAMKAPWSKEDCPAVARWIEVNEKPLAILTEGINRDRFFMPLITTEEPGMLISVLLPIVQSTRNFARVLKARAMLRLNEGDVEGAWRDLMTCHRLARHVAHGPTLIERLVGIAIDGIALDGDQIIAQSDRLMTAQALKFRSQLEELPPIPRMVDSLNTAERFMFLDAVNHLARGTPGVLEMVGGLAGEVDGDGPAAALTKLVSKTLIDWNEPMKMANTWYDKIVAGARLPTYRERAAAAEKLNEQIKDLVMKAKDSKAFAIKVLFSGSPRKAVGQQIGTILVALLLPAINAASNAEARTDMYADLTRVTFALAAYKTDHDAFPDSLDKLTPKYIAKMPQDFYVEKPLSYKRSEDGYVLYAVGPNGQDNDGFGPFYKSGDGDDIGIHFPRPKEGE